MKTLDANTLIANAVRNAWGYRAQATNYQNEALMARAQAKGISPDRSAMSSLLGSAGRVASSWYAFSKAGAFDDSSSSSNSSLAYIEKSSWDDDIYALGKQKGWY
ncbi:MAG: hypothetical protein LBI62_10540 [Candidatus Accumulibacter sp.]|nr:hypothetical protein [Accumulibacter sp.]